MGLMIFILGGTGIAGAIENSSGVLIPLIVTIIGFIWFLIDYNNWLKERKAQERWQKNRLKQNYMR